MALEGTIKEFGIADILQLIAQQQKTGILLIERGNEHAQISFLNGQIADTRVSSSRIKRDHLGKMLVDAKLISETDLEHALKIQNETYEYIGRILFTKGFIDKDNLQKAIISQAYETFYDILQWRDGVYRFVTDNVSIDADLISLPNLESMLLDVFRMIDEWPDVQKTVTTFNMVFGKVPEADQPNLDADSLGVLNLIDGKRTVQDIIHESLLGRFTTCKALCQLLEKGCITLLSQDHEGQPAGFSIAPTRFAGIAIYLGLCLSVLLLCIVLVGRLPGNIVPILDPAELHESYLYTYFTYSTEAKLHKGLKIFYLQHKQYPNKLEELSKAGILGEDEVLFYENSSFVYAKKGEFYTITLRE